MKREVIHLVGDFTQRDLDRWTRWAHTHHYDIKHSTFAELEHLDNPLIVLGTHGLNDLHLPGTTS